MLGIALALGGTPYEFEGERAGNAFWVFRIIGYPGISSAKNQEKPENDIGWYCNYAAVDTFFEHFRTGSFSKYTPLFFDLFHVFICPCCGHNFSGAHTDYGKVSLTSNDNWPEKLTH